MSRPRTHTPLMNGSRTHGALRTSLAVVLACALFLPSCGNDGTSFFADNGGIGGSGRSFGEITGFGSVFVNGVRWDTDFAEITVNGEESDESALRVGMVVTVVGDPDADDEDTGLALRIDYDSHLKGPISEIEEIGDQKLLTVLGVSVLVDVATTTVDGTTIDDLAVDSVIEVTGFVDGAGVLLSTRVEYIEELDLETTEVKIQGAVADFNGDDEFTIAGITVLFDPEGEDTDLDDLEDDIGDGLTVRVEGVLIDATTIDALAMKSDDDFALDDLEGEDTSLEGFISNYTGIDDFEVDNRPVDASDAELRPDNPDAFTDNAQVRVRGVVEDGVLVATSLELRHDRARVRGEMISDDDIDLDAGELTLLGVTVLFDASTAVKNQLLDRDSDDDSDSDGGDDAVGAFAKLADVGAGSVLSVHGFEDGPATITAVRILVKDSSSAPTLRGLLEAFDEVASTVTVLGIEVTLDADTDLEIDDDGVDTLADFFAGITIGDLIQVKDNKDDDNTLIDVAVDVTVDTAGDGDSDD